jgi:hypothetical protein
LKQEQRQGRQLESELQPVLRQVTEQQPELK